MTMHVDFRAGLGRLLDPRYPYWVVVFSLVSGFFINWGAAAATEFWSPSKLVVACVFVLLLLWLGAACHRHRENSITISGTETAPARRGLICMVSNKPTILRAVKHHAQALTHLWLITTTSRMSMAQELEAECKAKAPGLEVNVVPLQEGDIVNHRAVEKCVDDLYFNLPDHGLQASEVIGDLTGGTVIMSVGMLLACLDADRDLEYVPQATQATPDGQTKPVGTGAPILIRVERR